MNSFNLVKEPWIKAIDFDSNTRTVSILELLKNADKFWGLANDMQIQDLSILRLLLAILTTVYSRVNAEGKSYAWLTLDDQMRVTKVEEEKFNILELFKTWKELKEKGNFDPAVEDYLDKNQEEFNFFGSKPFYQVSQAIYEKYIAEYEATKEKKAKNRPKKVKKKTTKGKKEKTADVTIKQLNRLISESNNSSNPFSPKSTTLKNKIPLDQLIRWTITYQNFTGTADKVKLDERKASRGWAYGSASTYIKGRNFFETLIYNLILVTNLSWKDPYNVNYSLQNPVWEQKYEDWIKKRQREDLSKELAQVPQNIAELYTVQSRLIYIDWSTGKPSIFTVAMPKLNNIAAYQEPMTTWKKDKKGNYVPIYHSKNTMNRAIWRTFGNLVPINSEDNRQKLGSLNWLRRLRQMNILSSEERINLISIYLIGNGKPDSGPIGQAVDNMQINADVLFDSNPAKADYWPGLIEDMVEVTQDCVQKYSNLIWHTENFRHRSSSSSQDASSIANRYVEEMYDLLNQPFNDWLGSLSNDEDRIAKVGIWEKNLYSLLLTEVKSYARSLTLRDILASTNQDDPSFYKRYNFFNYYIRKKLLPKGDKKS